MNTANVIETLPRCQDVTDGDRKADDDRVTHARVGRCGSELIGCECWSKLYFRDGIVLYAGARSGEVAPRCCLLKYLGSSAGKSFTHSVRQMRADAAVDSTVIPSEQITQGKRFGR